MHPYNSQEILLRYCKENGVAVTAFSSLGTISYEELGMTRGTESCSETALIKGLATKHSKSPAQILLKWAVQRGTAIIPKSSKPERLAENRDMFGWELSDEDMQAVNGMNQNLRFNEPALFTEAAFKCFYPIFQ